ncbi:hypothetical protein ABID21_000859 [Pseudorhizobium tarimense]|uniref:Uncharacterized protein n=1 Tax=Pseudorhizobium tarimense TaxID=1079109 RepID=A0ABV2H2J0_9HYPH
MNTVEKLQGIGYVVGAVIVALWFILPPPA